MGRFARACGFTPPPFGMAGVLYAMGMSSAGSLVELNASDLRAERFRMLRRPTLMTTSVVALHYCIIALSTLLDQTWYPTSSGGRPVQYVVSHVEVYGTAAILVLCCGFLASRWCTARTFNTAMVLCFSLLLGLYLGRLQYYRHYRWAEEHGEAHWVQIDDNCVPCSSPGNANLVRHAAPGRQTITLTSPVYGERLFGVVGNMAELVPPPSPRSHDALGQFGRPPHGLGCANFTTFGEAKEYYDRLTADSEDASHMDGDGDGRPCEGLLRRREPLIPVEVEDWVTSIMETQLSRFSSIYLIEVLLVSFSPMLPLPTMVLISTLTVVDVYPDLKHAYWHATAMSNPGCCTLRRPMPFFAWNVLLALFLFALYREYSIFKSFVIRKLHAEFASREKHRLEYESHMATHRVKLLEQLAVKLAYRLKSQRRISPSA